MLSQTAAGRRYGRTQVPNHPGAPGPPGVCGAELGLAPGGRGGVRRRECGHDLRFSRAALLVARRLVGAVHVVVWQTNIQDKRVLSGVVSWAERTTIMHAGVGGLLVRLTLGA